MCRSSGVYEAVCSSGCVKLPSQRTLGDYTHYVTACTGFSSKIDQMLIKAAKGGKEKGRCEGRGGEGGREKWPSD